MSDPKSPREFWIREAGFSFDSDVQDSDPWIGGYIHVIEKSAFDVQAAEITELNKMLLRLVNTNLDNQWDLRILRPECERLKAKLHRRHILGKAYEVSAESINRLAGELDEVKAENERLKAFKQQWDEKDGNSPGYNYEKAKLYGEQACQFRNERDRLQLQVEVLKSAANLGAKYLRELNVRAKAPENYMAQEVEDALAEWEKLWSDQ